MGRGGGNGEDDNLDDKIYNITIEPKRSRLLVCTAFIRQKSTKCILWYSAKSVEHSGTQLEHSGNVNKYIYTVGAPKTRLEGLEKDSESNFYQEKQD